MRGSRKRRPRLREWRKLADAGVKQQELQDAEAITRPPKFTP
jgi:hypothetical protein